MTRAEEYRQDVESLQKEIEFENLYNRFRAQLFNQYKQYDGESLVRYKSQVRDLFGPKFEKLLDKVDQEYDQVLQLVNEQYSDMGTDISRDIETIKAIEQINATRWGEYNDETVQAIARQWRESRIKGETKDELVKRFETKLDGKVVSYAETLGRTMIKGHGQEAKNTKAEIAEINFRTYVGPPVRTKGLNMSHVFCIEMFRQRDRTFDIKDIRKMSNGQLDPVERYRGGYNCRHDWEPDPFYKKKYSVSFVTVPDSNRDVVIAQHN